RSARSSTYSRASRANSPSASLIAPPYPRTRPTVAKNINPERAGIPPRLRPPSLAGPRTPPPSAGRPASRRHETRDSVRSDAVDVRFHGVAPNFRSGAAGSGVADGDSDGRVAGGAVGLRLGLERGLGIAGLVGGPRLEQVVPRRGRPLPDPLPPGVDVRHRGQPRLVPCSPVDPDLDRLDPLVLGPRHPGHRS